MLPLQQWMKIPGRHAVNLVIIFQMYLHKVVKKEIVYAIIHAIERDAKINLNVMTVKKGMPPDYIIMALTITLRQVIRSNIKSHEQRLNKDLSDA